MKKFYEKPVVEITKFAFEDIMATTKSVNIQVPVDDLNAQAVINEIEAKDPNAQAKRFGLYKW